VEWYKPDMSNYEISSEEQCHTECGEKKSFGLI